MTRRAATAAAAWLCCGTAWGQAADPPPPPYDRGGGRPITLADGELVDRDTVYRFLPATLPLPSIDISSPFGLRRNPFGGTGIEMHAGTDFPAPVGTPVQATAAGRVTAAGPAGNYGLMVELTHPFGFVTRYSHLSAVSVTVGQVVDRYAVLGRVGDTGRSTGSHLYWETWRDGRRIDPVAFAMRAYDTYQELGRTQAR